MRSGLPVFCSAVLALTALAGCAHYHLGTQGHLAFTTMYVAPVRNRTLLPEAQAAISTQLRSDLAEDGRIELVNSPEAADVTLQVVLTNFHRDVAAQREQDTGLASKFQETLASSCSLRDNRTGKALFENRPVVIQRAVFTDNGDPHSSLIGNELQSEYNSLPFLAQALARRISQTVLDVW